MADKDARILVVDDEPDILEFVGYNLEKAGYQVKQASNGFEALELAQQHDPHLILLDIMMPEMDGVSACHKFRNDKTFEDTLIAFLTARHEEYSEIAGLGAGADDYIHKPISPRLLNSRVKALLRRHKSFNKNEESRIDLGALTLDREKYEVMVESHLLELARKEFEVLWLLAGKPGKVFSREEIYRQVWGSDVIVGNRTIDVHISKLRTKLKNRFIKTVKGIGYKIE
ncbi:UNVERIFIED_CONTAM: hypothetical protein GTU68_063554 [Idotea baltica]|nr:hypothetical protein [Idotea baltica]